DSGSLGIPLVEADEDSNLAVFGVEDLVIRAWVEVVLLVEAGILRDVHLAVTPDHLTIAVEDNRGVVRLTVMALIQRASDENNAVLLCDLREGVGSSIWKALRFSLRHLFLREIERIEQFGEADNLGPLIRGCAHHL